MSESPPAVPPAPEGLAKDPLTGLATRALFHELVRHSLSRLARDDHYVAVLFCDIDGFKPVNDAHGYEVGDALLVATADRITSSLRPSDVVARFGSDEFVVCLCEVRHPSEVEQIAERIRNALAQPFQFRGVRVFVSLSIGIAIASGATDTPERLVRHADAAMERVKRHGKNGYEIDDRGAEDDDESTVRLQVELHDAIRHGELEVHYQPIRDIRRDEFVALEALARWRHPKLGLLPAGRFIGIADRCGLMGDVGNRIIEDALVEASGWVREPRGRPRPRLFVNAAEAQLADRGFASWLEHTIEASGFPASLLLLEVTERVTATDTPLVLETLNRVRDFGVRVAIDDFGAGYSSLSRLRHFPIDVIKVDRSLVQGVDDAAPFSRSVLTCVLGLTESLGIDCIAEGVETAVELEALRAIGFRFLQGYHLARPATGRVAWPEPSEDVGEDVDTGAESGESAGAIRLS